MMSKLTDLLQEVADNGIPVLRVFIGDHELFPGVAGTSIKMTIERISPRNPFFLKFNHPGLGASILSLPDLQEHEALTVKWIGDRVRYLSWGNVHLSF